MAGVVGQHRYRYPAYFTQSGQSERGRDILIGLLRNRRSDCALMAEPWLAPCFSFLFIESVERIFYFDHVGIIFTKVD